MTEKELPKRRFALEEKDLAVEADENNKVAEEKENKFLKKIQEDATSNIQHLPDEKILDRLPDPTGWRMLVLPYKGQGKTKGGVILTDETRFPKGPWCKKGDWIIFGRYAGSRFGIEGGEVRILNEDEIIAVVKDPEDILQFR